MFERHFKREKNKTQMISKIYFIVCIKTTTKYEMIYVMPCNTAEYHNKISLKHN